MADPLLKSTILTLYHNLQLSEKEDGSKTFNDRDGLAVVTDKIGCHALEIFSHDRSLEEGVLMLEKALPPAGPVTALEVVMNLLDKGFLLPVPLAKKRLNTGMFGCPKSVLEDVLSGEDCQIVFVGMPYGLGVTGKKGTETGPEYLRRASRTAFDYTEVKQQARGWWHPQLNQRVLENIQCRDIGNIEVDSVRNGSAFDKLHAIITKILQAGRVPVVMGGDHSISLASITAAADQFEGLGILQFDAHSDIGSRADMGNWRRNCSHGNFMSWLIANPRISCVHQFGVRHLLPESPATSGKLSTYTAYHFIDEIKNIVAALPKNRPYYLTFDVDCLDPSLVSQTGTPIPGGLTYREAIHCLDLLTLSLDIIGVDIVEMIQADDPRNYDEGITVSYILFEILCRIFKRRQHVAQLQGYSPHKNKSATGPVPTTLATS